MEECINILKSQSHKSNIEDRIKIIDFLQKIPHFKKMISLNTYYEKMYELSQYLEYEEHQYSKSIYNKGDSNKNYYIIIQGSVSLYVPKST